MEPLPDAALIVNYSAMNDRASGRVENAHLPFPDFPKTASRLTAVLFTGSRFIEAAPIREFSNRCLTASPRAYPRVPAGTYLVRP